MDIKQRIKTLQRQKGWTNYRLSLEAGLTTSTVSNLFTRKGSPSIGTLQAICEAFGISLSAFFETDETKTCLSADEKKLIDDYRALSPAAKKGVGELMDCIRKERKQ